MTKEHYKLWNSVRLDNTMITPALYLFLPSLSLLLIPLFTNTSISFFSFKGQNDVGSIAFPRAVVVAQLVEPLLPIPEVCGSNPVIGKLLY